jgi:integrase/recombinase XerC
MNVSVRKYVSIFKDYLLHERNYSTLTVEAYMSDLEQFIAYLESKEAKTGESFMVDIVDADIVREWLMDMMGRRMAATSVNRKLSALKSFFKFLRNKQIVEKHPLMRVTGPKKAKPLPSFVKDRDMIDLLDEEIDNETFEKVRDRLMMELLYETGIRCAELVGIADRDIDLSAMMLKVTGKRNKQRLIPFADRLKAMIGDYLNVRAKTVGSHTEAFFVRKDGRKVSSAVVYYRIRKGLMTIPALSKRSPHVLRHTFATSMLNNEAELNAVKTLLGHSSLASTAIYTHLTFEELKRVYNAHPRAKNRRTNYGHQD